MTTTTNTIERAILERQLVAALLFREVDPAQVDAAYALLDDGDVTDGVCRTLWQASRDCWESRRAVDLGLIQRDVRGVLGAGAPTLAWYRELADAALVGLDLLEIARMVGHAACDDVEASARRRVAMNAAEDDAAAFEAALEDLRAAQERRAAIDSGAATRPVGSRDLTELFAAGAPPPADVLVERLIARPGVTIVFGASGSGKSYALKAAMLDLVMGGGAFAGVESFQIRPRSTRFGDDPDVVLWVFGSEDTEARIHRRALEVFSSGPHAGKQLAPGRFRVASPPPGVCLGSREGIRWLDRQIAHARASVVILDTIQSLTSATIEANRGDQVARWMSDLHRLRDKHQAVILPVAHTSKTPGDAKSPRTKADSLLGSQAWRALADGLVMIDAPDGDASQAIVRVLKGKDIDDPPPPTRIAFDGAAKRFHEALDDAPPPHPEMRPGRPPAILIGDILALRDGHPDGVRWTAIPALIGASKSTWYDRRAGIQDELLALGHVVVGGILRWSA